MKTDIQAAEESAENEKPADLLAGKSGLEKWFTIFWLFIKVNVLTTSGPASVGLLYKEAVGRLMTENEFVEAVGFSSVVPGSEAMKLAMFVGYAAGGAPGAIAALAGAILPPTIMMLIIVMVLERLGNEIWIDRFVNGLVPAVAVLILIVAWEIFKGNDQRIRVATIVIALISLAALLLDAPAPLVLLGAGILGIIMFR